MATTGEYALDSLNAFQQIYDAVSEDTQPPLEVTDLFVVSSLKLRSTFPGLSKIDFGHSLPFTDLELHMLETNDWHADMGTRVKVASRLGDWIAMSSIYLDERNVDCASFLLKLWPNLDLWDERVQVEKLAAKLTPDIIDQ